MMHLHAASLELTCAGLESLKPPVSSLVVVAGTSAVLVPSTPRSATTDSAGFHKCAALWTCHRISDP